MNKDRHEWFIFTSVSTFMESDFVKDINQIRNYDITFIGIPHDIWSSYRRWSMFWPQALREISMWEKLNWKQFFDTYSWGVINTNIYSICDFWDIFLSRADIEKAHSQIYKTIKEVKKNSFPIIMWWDHSIAYSTIRWCIEWSGIPKEKIAILQIDAHCDTEEGCLWLHKLHHWAPFRLLIEEWHILWQNLFTIWPRWILPNYQIEYAKEKWIHLHTMPNIRKVGFEKFLESLLEELSKYEAVYITLDVDSMNPAEIRWTGTPVEWWFFSYEIQELIRKLKNINIIGFEMVELAPEFDQSWYSTIVASNILWQFLAIWLTLKK